MTNQESSWSRITRWRTQCGRRFGEIRRLPYLFPKDQVRALLKREGAVLDLGAGADKPLQALVREGGARYVSLDTDPLGEFDFRSFEQMPADMKFDLMVANQLLEHLPPAQALALLVQARAHLAAQGHLVATVPNALHPVRQWGDAFHLTAWPAHDLYGLLREAGFEVVALGRYNRRPLTRNPFKRLIALAVCDVFRMDWCDSLTIVGRNSAAGGPSDG